MSYAAVLLAPLMVVTPSAIDSMSTPIEAELAQFEDASGAGADAHQAPSWNQMRIEQRTTIRVAPRAAPARPRPTAVPSSARRPAPPKLVERRMGKCIPAARIGGVEVDMGKRLILYLHDRRMVSAELERSCRARDFYSGFYLSNNRDGQLCVDRDTLLSRTGANCKLTRIRQLVPDED